MHASQPHMSGAVIDVSIEEALATMAMAELAGAGLHGRSRSRRRVGDGNGATVCILPARDGYAAISPREDRQWAAWLVAMGSPDWGGDPRFASKADRVANWDALHALMSAWSRQHDKQWIADTAQAARVPSFPLRELPEQLHSPQLDVSGCSTTLRSTANVGTRACRSTATARDRRSWLPSSRRWWTACPRSQTAPVPAPLPSGGASELHGRPVLAERSSSASSPRFGSATS